VTIDFWPIFRRKFGALKIIRSFRVSVYRSAQINQRNWDRRYFQGTWKLLSLVNRVGSACRFARINDGRIRIFREPPDQRPACASRAPIVGRRRHAVGKNLVRRRERPFSARTSDYSVDGSIFKDHRALEDRHVACVETKSWEEQVAAFVKAEVILAPHGAALANIAFCKASTLVARISTREAIKTSISSSRPRRDFNID
jgi:hypothetical protein